VRCQTQVAEVAVAQLQPREVFDSEAIQASACCAQAAIDRWRGLAPLKPSAIAEGNEVALQGTVNSISPAGNILHITPEPRPPASLMPNVSSRFQPPCMSDRLSRHPVSRRPLPRSFLTASRARFAVAQFFRKNG
jgi:hypothetical protein